MICFEIRLNGRILCTAGVEVREADMTALVCAVGASMGPEPPQPVITLDVSGAADDVQMTWLERYDGIHAGDTVTLQILERGDSDPPRTRRDTRTLQMRREADRDPDVARCCFCHRAQSEHRKLVAGPPVFICGECVTVCAGILEQQG